MHLLNPYYESSKTDLTRQNERVSDKSVWGKCLVGIPNPLFHTFKRRPNTFCGTRCHGLSTLYSIFSFRTQSVNYNWKILLTQLALNPWSTKKWICGGGMRTHPSHPPPAPSGSPTGLSNNVLFIFKIFFLKKEFFRNSSISYKLEVFMSLL